MYCKEKQRMTNEKIRRWPQPIWYGQAIRGAGHNPRPLLAPAIDTGRSAGW